MLFKAEYQPAELYAPTKGTWRISWYNNNPKTNTLERVQKTFSLNRIKSVSERTRVGKNYVSVINEALKNGYNYFTDTLGIADTGNAAILPVLTIKEVVEQMLPIRLMGCKKERSKHSYRSFTKVFCEWLTERKYDKLPAENFKHMHWLEFMQFKQAKGHGNRNINDFTNYFKTTFSEAIPMELLKVNPLEKINFLDEAESTLFAEIAPEELTKIKDELLNKHPRYYIYTRFTSDEYVRPMHIAFIKASDIDYENDIIRTYDLSAKNDRINEKQLLPGLKKLLIEYGYHKLPGEWYLFGKGFEPSPAPYKSLSNRSSEVWRKLIIDGLGINKKMYALKHTSGTHLINANENIDVAWLSKQMEHSTLAQTETYIKNRKTKKIDTRDVNLLSY